MLPLVPIYDRGDPPFHLTPIEQPDRRPKEFIATFAGLWKAKRGGEYRVIGGRDGTAIKTLLAAAPEATTEEFRRRAEYALSDEWFRRNGNIASLCYGWSKYEPPHRVNGKVALGVDTRTGEVRYR